MPQFEPFPLLESKRLLLRETAEQDLDKVLFLRSNASMLEFLHKKPMKDRNEAALFLARLSAQRLSGESIEWCITRKPAATMIGSICLWNFSGDGKKAEVGYLLHPDQRSMGLMSEALAAVIGYGFETLALRRIEAYTHRKNEPSLRLLERHGFRITPEMRDFENEENVILALENKPR